jgi:hypothetical protein
MHVSTTTDGLAVLRRSSSSPSPPPESTTSSGTSSPQLDLVENLADAGEFSPISSCPSDLDRAATIERRAEPVRADLERQICLDLTTHNADPPESVRANQNTPHVAPRSARFQIRFNLILKLLNLAKFIEIVVQLRF